MTKLSEVKAKDIISKRDALARIRREVPGAMSVILKRQGDILKMSEEYKPAPYSETTAREAVRAFADWNNSDPFAGSRMALYIRRGFESAVDVKEDYHKRVIARDVARRREEGRDITPRD